MDKKRQIIQMAIRKKTGETLKNNLLFKKVLKLELDNNIKTLKVLKELRGFKNN